jgi:HSP20 family molecular chaperone IbpA
VNTELPNPIQAHNPPPLRASSLNSFLPALSHLWHLPLYHVKHNVSQTNKKIEEKAADAVAQAKEAEEQAALPYQWTQTIGDLDITTDVPGNLKSRDFVVEIKKTKLTVGIKGQEPILSVRSLHRVNNRRYVFRQQTDLPRIIETFRIFG